jgi:hypothetical protein
MRLFERIMWIVIFAIPVCIPKQGCCERSFFCACQNQKPARSMFCWLLVRFELLHGDPVRIQIFFGNPCPAQVSKELL